MSARKTPLVTVFGGGGFIGRYVCEYLLKSGARIRVAQRHPKRAFFLQPLGQVGQVEYVAADVTRPATVEAAVLGADAVINLVSVMGGAMEKVNAEGAGNVARAAKAAGAKALVQVSAIGADANSDARYARSKAGGEDAATKAFKKATIIRPSVVFGAEDEFSNRFASLIDMLPFYPVIAPETKFQPIFVRDLGKAISAAALDPASHGGKTYELGGPDVMTMRELTEKIAMIAGVKSEIFDLPDFASAGMARLGFLPGAPITWDQWLMLQKDNVAAPRSKGLAAIGIDPTPFEAVAGEWLGRFRTGGRFAALRDGTSQANAS